MGIETWPSDRPKTHIIWEICVFLTQKKGSCSKDLEENRATKPIPTGVGGIFSLKSLF